MLTKGAIGNLVNRYRAVLKKCNLINTFGSLAVASMLVLGGAGVAGAAEFDGVTRSNLTIKATSSLHGGVISTLSNHHAESIKLTDTENTFKNSLFIANKAENSAGECYGGVAYNAAGYTLNFEKSQFIGNNLNGVSGSIARGGVIANAGKLNITGCEFNGNTSTRTGTTNDQYGSAIHNAGTLTITDSIFKNHSGGRAIYNSGSGSATLNGNTFENNARGCVQTEAGASITFDGTNAFKNNGSNSIKNKGVTTFAEGSETIFEGNKVDIDNDASKSENKATINIGKESSVKMDGGMIGGGTVNIEGDLSGRIYIEEGSTDPANKLFIAESGNWTAAGESTVSSLDLDGGSVSIPAGADVSAGSTSGSGNINMENADDLGSFTSNDASGASLQVRAMDKGGKIQNADKVSPEQLEKMWKAVDAEGATVTALAEEGLVEGKITVSDAGDTVQAEKTSEPEATPEQPKPQVHQARNTVMDAALQQASVTTVALDKLLTNDVRKRLGDIRSDKNTTGVWMRWDGGKLKGDAGVTNDFNTIQIGGDTKVAKNCRIGVAGSFTHGDAEFARGTSELEGFSFAAYATWMGDNGMFADVVTRLGHFSNEMKVEGLEGDIDSRVFSLSGEYGWRFNVCEQFFVEPQVELAYTYVSSDNLQLGTAQYAFDSVDSLTGRAGVAFGWNLPNDRGSLYARASVVQQFLGDAKISGVNGEARNVQELDGNDTWLEYGIGANVKLTDKAYIWADVERTEGADIEEEWRGTIGIRYSF